MVPMEGVSRDCGTGAWRSPNVNQTQGLHVPQCGPGDGLTEAHSSQGQKD